MAIIKRPKISVAVITYNQEKTIQQTLDSILAQKGDFDLELVIGEDCSPDGTYAVCADYAKRYPDEVKLLPNTKNLGIMANYARVIQACTGNFISNIAGDDYYCDEYALVKQMQYMIAHKEVGVVAANGYSYYVQRDKKVPGLNPFFEPEHVKIKDYYFSPAHFEGACLAPVGMMYRAELLKKYVDFDVILRRRLPVEDYPIQAILSQHTKFACLPDLLVTYRVYKESASFISYTHPRYAEYYRGLIEIRRYLNELFPKDAIPEETLLEYEFYKEFLLYLHKLDYRKAKQLIVDAAAIANKPKVKQAKLFTKTWLHFIAVHYIKEFNYHKDLKRRV